MRTPWPNPRGSITLVALCLAIVIGISLASYLALCQQSLLLSTRTIQLNKARQLAETGLEEALWALNAAANPDTTISNTAWKISTTAPTVPTGSVTWNPSPTSADRNITITGYDLGNGATGKIEITITSFDGPKAAVSSPIASIAVPAPTITVTATVAVPGLGDFKRTLTAPTRPAPFFANAIGVSNSINNYILLFGGTVIDSWNSDPNLDFNPDGFGVFPYSFTAGTKSNYAAVVAATSIFLNNTATIYGYAATFGNSISSAPAPLSTNCLIKGPATLASDNIDKTRVSKSAFVPNFPVAAPTGAAFGTLNGSTTTIDNSSGIAPQIWDANPTDLTLNGTTITIKGRVIIRVAGSLSLISGGNFVIYKPTSPGPDKGQLEIFVRDDVTISPGSGFQNDTHEPKNLALYSTNTGTRSFTYNSNLDFYGVMYTASTTSNLQIATSPNFYGAILTQFTPRIDNNPYFHYDLALQYLPKGWFKGVTTPFMITQLTETP